MQFAQCLMCTLSTTESTKLQPEFVHRLLAILQRQSMRSILRPNLCGGLRRAGSISGAFGFVFIARDARVASRAKTVHLRDNPLGR